MMCGGLATAGTFLILLCYQSKVWVSHQEIGNVLSSASGFALCAIPAGKVLDVVVGGFTP